MSKDNALTSRPLRHLTALKCVKFDSLNLSVQHSTYEGALQGNLHFFKAEIPASFMPQRQLEDARTLRASIDAVDSTPDYNPALKRCDLYD